MIGYFEFTLKARSYLLMYEIFGGLEGRSSSYMINSILMYIFITIEKKKFLILNKIAVVAVKFRIVIFSVHKKY